MHVCMRMACMACGRVCTACARAQHVHRASCIELSAVFLSRFQSQVNAAQAMSMVVSILAEVVLGYNLRPKLKPHPKG